MAKNKYDWSKICKVIESNSEKKAVPAATPKSSSFDYASFQEDKYFTKPAPTRQVFNYSSFKEPDFNTSVSTDDDYVSGQIVEEVEEKPYDPSWIPEDMPVTRETLLASLQVTPEEREKIWNYAQGKSKRYINSV